MKKWIALILIGLLILGAGCKSANNTLDWESIEASAETAEGEEAYEGEPEAGTDDPFAVETVAASPDEPVAAAFGAQGGWGYINTSGEWVIAPQYAMAYPFVDNVASVQLFTNEWQLIDKSGAVITQFPADIQVYEPLWPYVYPECGETASSGCTIFDGMIIICRDADGNGYIGERGVDLFGYADTAGNIVVEPQYLNAGAFGDGPRAGGYWPGGYKRQGRDRDAAARRVHRQDGQHGDRAGVFLRVFVYRRDGDHPNG